MSAPLLLWMLAAPLLVLVFGLPLAGTAGAATGSPVNVVLPSIAGIAKDEQALKANRGKWTGETPIVYAFQWEHCDASGGSCEDIASAIKASYRATHVDVGHTLRVRVGASNLAGGSSATSGPSVKILPSAPRRKALAKITGTAEDGQLLTVGNGTWHGTPPFSYAYQWEACNGLGTECSLISGATTASYRAISSQIGGKLRAIITASNVAGSGSATSYASRRLKAGPPVNTAAPVISGSLQEGQTLSAATGTWAGTVPFAFTYQWQRCNISGEGCEDIVGATAPSYSLTAADLASRLTVRIAASNALGAASATSDATQPILPSNTLLPAITGLLQDGQLLSVGTGGWSGTGPISFSFQWQLCNGLGLGCLDIPGATGSSLKISPGDIGGVLDVVVTASNAAGSSSVTTPITSLIAGLLPSNTSLPAISGLLQDGQLLSVGSGSWSGSGPISYSYQWQQCNASGKSCSNISGATGSTLSLLTGLIGSTLDVVVTATNVAGSTSATTPVTGLIGGLLPSNTALPSISGALQEGQSLGASSGTWSGTQPISYSYQWQQCNASGKSCSNISGATGSTLSLLTGLIGSTLDVVVTATNVAGSTSATTPVTGLITGILPTNTVLPAISGLLVNGSLLSASTGTWSGTQPMTFTYQWQLCNAVTKSCANISEAVNSTLKLSLADVGGLLDVVVKATNVAGSTSVTSSLTGLIGL